MSSKGRKYKTGFTLVEVMIVLFIILSIAGSAVLAYGTYLENSKKKTTQMYISTLATAIKLFNVNVGRHPSGLQDLADCPSGVDPNKWGGPYVEVLKLADPWQNEYRYISPGQHKKDFDVWSVGPDGQDGTEDDIGNWSN
ncbi:MAG: type II secretion system major pseudopilin GspG [Planctomycetaceae bacterium]|nr:type II secretion system major pseudopilin GspG [Planctomycetaceae bacterium]